MRSNHLKALCIGAMSTLLVSGMSSCQKKDVDDLKTRVEVLEGSVHQLQEDLKQAMVTGSTIISATKDAKGVWTLVLSNGQEITIQPSSGGGSTVTVEETEDAIIITVNGTSYAIPKTSSAAINSFIFCPIDGENTVELGNDGIEVFFLATPGISQTDLESTEFSIADARPLTKAGQEIFKVKSAELDGDLIKIKLKGRSSAVPDETYTVSLKVSLKKTVISSNYFFIHVSDDFSTENLEAPVFKAEVELTTLDGELTGYHRAKIPNSAANFVKGFNLKDWYQSLPEGEITFELAPKNLQNDNVKNRYDVIREALSEDGTWELKQRLGTDAWNDAGKNGIIIYMLADDFIKNKIFWQIDNPVPGMGLDRFLGEGYPDSQHIEYGAQESVNLKWIIPAGEGTYDLAKIFLTADFPEGELLPEPLYLRHGNANTALQMIQNASLMKGDDELLGNDGSKFVLGDELKALVGHGRGLVWRTTQPSWASSIRENWTDEAKALSNGENNGEIIGGWDGGGDIPGLMGWEMNEKGLVTSSDYAGWAFRSGVGLYFEYELGEQTIGPWHWFYMWFNRRVCPEGAIDPSAR